jgi:hypothetical protein
MDFVGYEAASAAGLDLWKWEMHQYDHLFRAKIVAWYNLHRLVQAHSDDAAYDKSEQK